MQEPPSQPGVVEFIAVWGTSLLSWATGEVGKVMVAGAAGGFLRWIMDGPGRRNIRNGAVQVGSGAICAHYLSSFVIGLLSVPFGQINDRAMGGFIAGLLGISLAKIIIAMVEARTRNLGEGEGHEHP